MKRASRHNSSGQMAVFFAIAFTFFLVMMMTIINAGILTRDRIKLQKTADLAALIGANVQRLNLDQIGEHNRDIKKYFEYTRLFLKEPITASFCFQKQITCGESPTRECKYFCSSMDSAIAEAQLNLYHAKHTQYMNQMLMMIHDTNAKAFEYATLTALGGPNLPHDVRRTILKKQGGRYPTLNKMKQRYESGGFHYDYNNDGDYERLKDIYSITNLHPAPLYKPKLETKKMWTFIGQYAPCVVLLAFDAATPCWQWKYLLKPGELPVRIQDAGGLTPAFFNEIKYSPQYDFNLFKFPIKMGPDRDNPFVPGKVVQGKNANSLAMLFDILLGKPPLSGSLKKRQYMRAWATARPYKADRDASTGEYDGAKLIGIASKAIGEIDQDLNIQMPFAMEETPNTQHLFTERDFLH